MLRDNMQPLMLFFLVGHHQSIVYKRREFMGRGSLSVCTIAPSRATYEFPSTYRLNMFFCNAQYDLVPFFAPCAYVLSVADPAGINLRETPGWTVMLSPCRSAGGHTGERGESEQERHDTFPIYKSALIGGVCHVGKKDRAWCIYVAPSSTQPGPISKQSTPRQGES